MADAGSTCVVKFECGDDRRRVRLADLSYEALQQAASEAYADVQEMPTFDLKYRDEDGDFCTLTPATFMDFLDVTGSQATKLVRLTPRCPAASACATPRAAPFDAADAAQENQCADAADAFCWESANDAQAEQTFKTEELLREASSDSSSSSSDSSYASSCNQRLETAKQACVAAKQAWKEAKLHYKSEVKAVRQSLKQAKKDWKREQKEKKKAMKRGGHHLSGLNEEQQYASDSQEDELEPLVSADWEAEARGEVEEKSTPHTAPAAVEDPLDPVDGAEKGQPESPPPQDDKNKSSPPPQDDKEKSGPPPQDDKEKSNLEILKEMGFEDTELNAQLLKNHDDNIETVLNILFGG